MKASRAILFLSILACFFGSHCCAQDHRILNASYAKMLKSLLKHNVPEMSCQQLVESKENYILLDTRELREYAVSHIKNARQVSYDQFRLDLVKDISKSTPIVCYCSVGYRSEKVAKQLIEAGYQSVWNLYGSSFEWANRNLPLVDSTGQTVQRIHAYNRLWGRYMKNPSIQKVY